MKPASKMGLPRNVWVLGWVSLFNDTATEMSYWLLPQFLVSIVGAGPMAFGFIEGAAETVASFARLASGYLADRLQRRKVLAGAGYTVANLTKPLLALSTSWIQVFWIRFADRAAKGFRGAPRDALLADSVEPNRRGAAFGLRQSMDSAGAILGPLSAVVLLPLFLGNVRWVFWAAAVPGMVSIFLVWVLVREIPPAAAAPTSRQPGAPFKLWSAANRPLLALLLAVGIFSLGNSSDLFLILRAQNLGVPPHWAPLLGLVFNIVYTLLSWPAGWLSDRLPRRTLVVLGYITYSLIYSGFALAPSKLLVWPLFAVYGAYYAFTEGILKAWIADLVPSHARASAYGVFNWLVGVAAFPASLLAGWLWVHASPSAPFYFGAAAAFLASLLLLMA
jgi:MFS family permease